MAKKDTGKKAAGKGAARKPSVAPAASPPVESAARDETEAARDNWATARAKFAKVFPNEYKRALGEINAKKAAKAAQPVAA